MAKAAPKKATTGKTPKVEPIEVPVGAAEAVRMSASDVAVVLGLSTRRLQIMANDGIVAQGKRGRYELAATVRAYVAFLKDEKRNASQTQAVAKKDDARTRLLELQIAERSNDLVSLEEHVAVVHEMAGIIKSALGGLSARASRDQKIRAEIDAAVHDTLSALASRLTETSRSLRASGVASGPIGSEDAG